MRPEEVIEERLTKAFAPALFADSLEAWIAAELLIRDLPGDHPRRAAAIWRALELRTAFDPAGVLAQCDDNPPPPDDTDRPRRVPVAAMIACGELDRAADALTGVTFEAAPAWDIVRGQLALARGDLERAEQLLARARADATDLEDRAYALLWSMEGASRRRDGDALVAHAGALDALLVGANAATSQIMAQLQAVVGVAGDRRAFLAPLYVRHAEEAKAALCEGVVEDQAALGPIPRHVHGAFRRLRGDPAMLEAALMNVAGLQVRADQGGEAYATLAYAARLATRLLPPPAAERMRAAFTRFGEVLGSEQLRAHEAYLAMREETFLRTMRRA